MTNSSNSLHLSRIRGCLGHLAQKSSDARRRHDNNHDYDPLPEGMDPYLIDRCKILNSKTRRRLMEKTQVLTGITNAHVRNRASHTDEVEAYAVLISECLGLNVNLTSAIAMGHDGGHTPFGHEGENFINSKLRGDRVSTKVFRHETMSAIVLDRIERSGRGLNLTYEVLKGIPQHSVGKKPMCAAPGMSQEAAVVMCADKIAYIIGDYSDMVRLGVPIPGKLKALMEKLGKSQRERMGTLITQLCLESCDEGKVSFCKYSAATDFMEIKNLMYGIYPSLNVPDGHGILERVYSFLCKFMNVGSEKRLYTIDPLLVLALMTDTDVLLLVSKHVTGIEELKQTSVWELLDSLNGAYTDYINPDLDW